MIPVFNMPYKTIAIKYLILILLVFPIISVKAENGYDLWLRYKPITDQTIGNNYRSSIRELVIEGNSPTIQIAKKELSVALLGLLNINIRQVKNVQAGGTLIVGTSINLKSVPGLNLEENLKGAGNEGFIIRNIRIKGKSCTVISANTDIGVLYGVYHYLRLLQTQQPVNSLNIVSSPKLKLRLLNHWDNLNRYVERGYAGISIWNWQQLPVYLDKRYTDYARANASIGINGTVLTNVNANAWVLSEQYLKKVAALADVFRPYGIKVYLTARFSAPIELGGLKTADPLNAEVKEWWAKKVNEIYTLIPDFGGLLVKANSEGQPGPQSYGRTHVDGANMLADVLAPHNGIVMWRAFVYSNEVPDDRHKQAYNEFVPLDGKFRSNVLVQVKNGPIDFQPREPFHPLFGAMPGTPLMMEFQLTQEYLGFSSHLAYLATMFKECLQSDTYAKGKGSTVARIIDGSLEGHTLTGMAGVSNIGNEINWTGHPFAQSNWYALGRLAWDHTLTAENIADEWIRMTFTNDPVFVSTTRRMILGSREHIVEYMTPLGLHHIMGYGHHYGPAPWVNTASRPDWNSTYYHRADSIGIGFERTSKGSDALAQYKPEVVNAFKDIKNCPDEYLLWFHHVPWNYKLSSGNTLWNELCYRYYAGADSVNKMRDTWKKMETKIDTDRFQQVKMLLDIQYNEAVWWRNACVLYFQTFSHLPIPEGLAKPDKTLAYYQSLKFPYAPGN